MSDDLVKRLVDWSEHDEGKINDARQEAADRIEELTEQLEAARADAKEAEAYAEELAGDQVDLCRQLIAAEDKLAKAVEALRGRMHCHDCTCGECDHIRATLAEIEGEKG
jgi:predicted  nucleic acid-binding Zn-ribbon protein